MTEYEPDILDATATPIGTTGRQLREAREARGYDIHTLSESLHLRPAVLIAIEQGDYREVPELFLKGYVRSYGRLVGLEGDRLVRQLESELQPLREEEAERQVESPTFYIEKKKRKKRRIAFWALLSTLFVVVILGLIRFQSMGYDFGMGTAEVESPEEIAPEAESAAEEVFSEPAVEPQNIELVDENTNTQSEAANAPDVMAPEEPAGSEPGIADRVGLEGDTLPPVATRGEDAQITVGEPEVAEPAVVPEAAEVQEPVIDQEDVAPVDEEPTPVEATPVAAPTDQVSFRIEFDGDCWLEIRNGSGERIFAGLMSAGDDLSRVTQAPVSFVIGNIQGIESFIFDDEPVDLQDYPSRNDRAEITLRATTGN